MKGRWFSKRALLLHLAIVVLAPSCLLAGRWQFERAMSGNALSWAYTFEWPAFCVLAVWVWWTLVHLSDSRPARASSAEESPLNKRTRILDDRRVPVIWDRAAEGDALRAYNTYLQQLQALSPKGARHLARPRGGNRD